MPDAHLKPDEIAALGFAAVGRNAMISRLASFHGNGRIAIGDNVRIDDFCILSAGAGGIGIGSYVHVAAYASLIGAGQITIEDFANLSSRVAVYSSSDDYSGRSMTNPMVPDAFKQVDARPVTIGRHVIIGSGSVILPGVTLGEGAAVGALALIKTDCDEFAIYAGNPALKVGERRRDLLELERRFLSGNS